MSKPFDATAKELVTSYPVNWLTQLGGPVTEPPEVLSAELSTVSATADTLIEVGDLVVHIDLESGPDAELARRMSLYNVLAHRHTKLPVRSIVLLLRSTAVGPTDGVAYALVPGSSELRFRFETVRAWELSAENLLNAGIGFLPLAVLGKPPAGSPGFRRCRRSSRGARSAPNTRPEPTPGGHSLPPSSSRPCTFRPRSDRTSSTRGFPCNDWKAISSSSTRATKFARETILGLGRHGSARRTMRRRTSLPRSTIWSACGA